MEIRKILLALGIFASSSIGYLYADNDFNTTIVNGKEYYTYTVKPSETLYGLSKKLNVSIDDIVKYNKNAAEGLKAGETILIPKGQGNSSSMARKKGSANEKTSQTHIVQKHETIYGIAKKYNITEKELIANNPAIENGLKEGQVLCISKNVSAPVVKAKEDKKKENKEVANSADVINKPQRIVTYKTKTGDTFYSISKQFNTKIEDIFYLNPGITPSSKLGNTQLKINENSNVPVYKDITKTQNESYKIEKGDTYYSVSKKYGVTVADIEKANPNVKKLKKGKTINVPVAKTERVLVSNPEGTESELTSNSNKLNELYIKANGYKKLDNINIALILPFMLNHEHLNKNDKLYTEFYKGFLLAVDDVRKTEKNNINIYTYDNNNSSQTLDSLLRLPVMKKMNLIIAPNNNAQISTLAKFGQKNKINIASLFDINGTDYESNPYMLQVNVSHSSVFDKVTEWFDKTFKGYEIVYLEKSNAEQKDIIPVLKKHFGRNNLHSQTLSYSSTLSASSLNKVLEPGKKYVLIPTSGTQKALSQIIHAIKNVKAERSDVEIVMLGHPEWSTYNYVESFQTINTYIYARFYVDSNDNDIKSFNYRYKDWYHESMIDVAPQFGLLGYDTGMYFIKSMCDNGNDFNKNKQTYIGLQNNINLVRANNWGGFINKGIYFIHFTPYKSIEKNIR